jgi:hypothetical protein
MVEQMDMANEISEMMGQPIGDDFDQDELDEDLEDLEAEVMEEEMMKQNEVQEEPFTLPDVPHDPINQNTNDVVMEEDDADALAQLEAEMA